MIYVLAGSGLVFLAGMYFHTDAFGTSLTETLLTVSTLAVTICAFCISKTYGRSKVFGKSYLAIGIGFGLFFVVDVIYKISDSVFQDKSYFIDATLLLAYSFIIAHSIINIRYFEEKFNRSQKALIIGIPIGIVALFSFISLGTFAHDASSFLYELLFVAASSVMISFAVVGLVLFRQSVIFIPWLLFFLGLLAVTIGDIVISYAFLFEDSNIEYIPNMAWFFSSLLIIYGLYRHRKAI